MKDRFAIQRETTGAIRHQALALGLANRLTQIGLGVQAEVAGAALWRVQRYHVIAHFEIFHPFTHFHNNAGAFVAEDRRERALRIVT